MEECVQETAITAAGLLSASVSVITSAVANTWTLVTSNPLTTFFVGSSILGVGFRFLHKAKRVSR